MKRRSVFHAVGTGKRVLAAAFALAGVTGAFAVWFVPNVYSRPGIPDYDQRRRDLPDHGNAYCVPTSCVDMLKYMSENGLPGMDGSFGNSYDDVTNFIFNLSVQMGTTTAHGTHSGPAFDVMFNWTNSRTNKLLVHTLYGASWDWGKGTIRNRIAEGAICRIGYGRYYNYGGSWHRDGGHSMALVGYNFSGSQDFFRVRDPAKADGDLDKQGDFVTEDYDTRNLTFTTTTWGRRTHAMCTLFTGDNGANNQRHVYDGMHCILPVFAGWLNTEVYTSGGPGPKPVPGKFKASPPPFTSTSPWNFGDPTPVTQSFTPFDTVVDWCYDIGMLGVFYITPAGKIYYANLTTGDHFFIQTIPGARKLVVAGTTLDLFVLASTNAGDTLVRLERDQMTLEEGKVMNIAVLRKTVALPGRASALDVDPFAGGVAVLSKDMDKVWSFGEDLLPKTTTPVSPPPSGSGEPIFRIDPAFGEIVYTRRGSSQFFAILRGGPSRGPRTSPSFAQGIESIELCGNGVVMVQDGGRLYTYDHAGQEVQTQLSGLAVNGPTKLIRSHVAADTSQMVGPEWRDVSPED
ncbi:MAG: hypothetical protein JSS65_00090 [Armatimonadetes bacterium]|nr:hypothetical protein [Armatimonadota bacterium]